MSVQINIIKAGAAVKNLVVDNKAFKVHNAEEFAALYRDAINIHARPQPLSHFLVESCISG